MVSNDLKTKVNAKIAECQAIAKNHFGKDIKPSKISYTAKGLMAGTANPVTYEIRLNAVFLNHYKDEFINDTVVHEYAHIVTTECYPDAAPHGKEWKKVMKLLRVEPNRLHAYSKELIYSKQKTRKYMCTCCYEEFDVTSIRHNRKMKNPKYEILHKNCKAPLIFVGP